MTGYRIKSGMTWLRCLARMKHRGGFEIGMEQDSNV